MYGYVSRYTIGLCAVVIMFLSIVQPVRAASIEEKVQMLEQIVQQQQQRLEEQAQTIKKLEEKLNSVTISTQESTASEQSREPAQPERPYVESGNDKVKVQLYGQLNRGVLLVDDGDSSKFYQVDNDNSSTRIGLLGSVERIEDWRIGTRFEVELESNSSSSVSQEEQNGVGGDSFNERWLEIFVESPYGKLSLGQGDTASNNASEVDLSGTTVAGYSDMNAVAGGQFYYDDDTNSLSSIRVKDGFSNFDGLSRDDRIRYDTPEWQGLTLATSAISGGGGDVALRYSYKNDQLKLASAVAYSNPGSTSTTIDDTVNGSVSVLHKSGFNLTLAGGVRDLKSSGRDDPTFFYTKFGYRANLVKFGESAFSLDYGMNDDVALDGDEAKTFGAQFVQYIDVWATEFYLSFRHYDLDRSGTDYQSVNAILSGLRVKF